MLLGVQNMGDNEKSTESAKCESHSSLIAAKYQLAQSDKKEQPIYIMPLQKPVFSHSSVAEFKAFDLEGNHLDSFDPFDFEDGAVFSAVRFNGGYFIVDQEGIWLTLRDSANELIF